MIRVLNIAQFIPIEGLQPDNDISLKIYSDLRKKYEIQSEFVKPVGNVLRLIAVLKSSSRIRRDIFSRSDYYDKKHGIRIHFYKDTFPLVNRLPFNSNFLLPYMFKYYSNSLLETVYTYKPDLIHAHSILPDGYYSLKLAERLNLPYILTIRGSFNKIYNSKMASEVLKNASAITTPNHNLWDKLGRVYKIELLPHGIDDIWFKGEDKTSSTGILRLVTVSRLLKQKNIQIVIKSIARLISEGYHIHYDIVGNGNYRVFLERLTKKLGLSEFVRFHGFQNADYIRKLYSQTDIFVMLSYPETFGLSFFEAAAMGLYIVGVEKTGAHGHLTEYEASFVEINEIQLADLIKKLDINEMKIKSERAKRKVEEFRNSKIIERYYNIIKQSICHYS